MGKKSTLAEKTKRVEKVYTFLLSGNSRPSIMEYARRNWGVKRATVDIYISEASQLISQEAKLIEQEAFEQHLAKRSYLYRQALENGDLRLAHDIAKDEAKLLSLYPVNKVQTLNLDIDLTQLSSEQLRRLSDGEDITDVIASSS